MKILLTLLVTFGAFVAWVAVTALVKCCSVREATQQCKKVCKEFLEALYEETKQPLPAYPVLVGWDGNRIVPQLVDDEFSKVRENFSSCYCCDILHARDGSFVKYDFAIMRKQKSIDDEYLEKLIQKQAEEVLACTMRCYDCYLPTEPLTQVELYRNKLCVFFARNDVGINILDNRKKQLRRKKIEATNITQNNLTESWNDKELQ